MRGIAKTRFVHHTTGYVFAMSKGHPRADIHGYVFEHLLVAEKALGRFLIRPNEVHHVNQDRSDNRNQNLVICENRAYHCLLHARTRVLRAGGDPDTDKFCTTCKQLKTRQAFTTDSRRWDGKAKTCLDCCRLAKERRRRASGARVRRADLTRTEDLAIGEAVKSGMSPTDICNQFHISRSEIRWVLMRLGQYVKSPGTHCLRGHLLTVLPTGRKVCHLCRAHSQRQYTKRKEATP